MEKLIIAGKAKRVFNFIEAIARRTPDMPLALYNGEELEKQIIEFGVEDSERNTCHIGDKVRATQNVDYHTDKNNVQNNSEEIERIEKGINEIKKNSINTISGIEGDRVFFKEHANQYGPWSLNLYFVNENKGEKNE